MPIEVAKCPKCKIELLNELHDYFIKNCTDSIFDFNCTKCGSYMEVSAESIPMFTCSIADKKFDSVGVGILL